MNNDQKKVLTALAGLDKPSSGKEIAAAAQLEPNDVAKHIKKLKDLGFVDSPVRCKYGVTEQGKQNI